MTAVEAHDQILTAAQMRAAEAALVAAGDTVGTLMERAGSGAAQWVYRLAAGRSVTVLCGPGNNGGDGWVIARVLAGKGVPVKVVAPLDPATDAARAARAAYSGPVVEAARGGVFVDCLFGTGLARPLDDRLAALLASLAAGHDLSIAVDLPSGVASDDGALLNPGLPHFHLTLALGAWKMAHWLMPAAAMLGERRLVDIGCGKVEGAARLAPAPRLRPPAPDAHKYSRGLVMVMAGAMRGAALLGARAAQHGGAGYVKLLGQSEGAVPADIVVEPRPASQALADRRIGALLAGPGLGRNAAAWTLLGEAVRFKGPLVLDADALMLLEAQQIAGRGHKLVLTPHAGELAALAASFRLDADLPRPELARRLASAAQAVIVAKGPDTLVAGPDGDLVMMGRASSWLSAAGTGDVLAGIVASRLAAGDDPLRAAIHACQLHAEAARRAGAAFSAGDLISHISKAYETFL